MLRSISAVAGAIAFAAVPALAQDHPSHQAQSKLMKGASVAIEGCVTAGEKADTYVLGSVKEIPGQPVDTGMKRVYWLDSRKHVRSHVGHVVELSGRIEKIEQAELEVKNTDEGMKVEIEGPAKQVTTSPAVVPVPTTGAKEVDIPTTVIRLKVDKVVVKGNCAG